MRRSPFPLILGAFCLGLVTLSAANPPTWRLSFPELPPPPVGPLELSTPAAMTPVGDTPPMEPYAGEGIPGWVWWTITILVAVVVLVLVVRIAARIIRALRAETIIDAPKVDSLANGRGISVATLTDEELDDAVTRSLRRLDAAAHPGDAIVEAWLALEESAADKGIDRDPASTPTEFTLEVLDRTAAPPEAVRRLLHLYHEARFSHRVITVADVAVARESLLAIAGVLVGSEGR